MSDSYEALIDCQASAEQAKELAPQIVACLADGALIVPTLSEDCVLGGQGYPPGPGCSAAYRTRGGRGLGPNRFWKLVTSGVQVVCEPWINIHGTTLFEYAECPRCSGRSGDDFLSEVMEGVEAFEERGQIPIVACPACGVKVHLHEWKCSPHLGFVNLSVVFWNWPPFDEDPHWKLDVPSLIEGKIGRQLLRTYGHL